MPSLKPSGVALAAASILLFTTGCSDEEETPATEVSGLAYSIEAYFDASTTPNELRGTVTIMAAEHLHDHDHDHGHSDDEHTVYEFTATRLSDSDSSSNPLPGIQGAWKAIAVRDMHDHGDEHMQAPIANASILPFPQSNDGHPHNRIIEMHLKNDHDKTRYVHYADDVIFPDISKDMGQRTAHPHGALKPEGFFLPVFSPEPSWSMSTNTLSFSFVDSNEWGGHTPDGSGDDGGGHGGGHDHDH